MNLHDIYWVAGILEGEGCFRLDPRPNGRGIIEVKVKMADLDVIERLRKSTNVGNVNGPYYNGNRKWKSMYVWKVGRQSDAVALMMTIYPLMGERRQEKIRELLAIWRSIPLPTYIRGWS